MNRLLLVPLLALCACASAPPKDSGAREPAATVDSATKSFFDSIQGNYRLESNDPKSECHGLDRISADDQFRIVWKTQEKSDEFSSAGSVGVFLQRYYAAWKNEDGSPGRWYRVFDQPDFSQVGQWTSRTATALGIISHKTTVDLKTSTVSHSTGQTIPLYGASAGIQSMTFDGQGRMVYTYVIESYNGFGKTTDSHLSQRCSFVKTN